MAQRRNEGFVSLDDRKRLALARYTDLEPGAYYHVTRHDDGSITLTPAQIGKEGS